MVIRGTKLENETLMTSEAPEVVVTKKGQTTIPVKLRKKYKIEEGTKLQVLDTEQGILLKPKKSIWDMIGAFSNSATADEIDKLLYKLRHEDE
jgi:AbrB family looped-hinge helix DNA binding protein